jgi:hypothetical protein
MSPTDLAWLAGLLEGEGYFGIGVRKATAKNRQLRDSKTPRITLTMTDEDVVRRAHALAGVGKVYGPYARGEWKPQWSWMVANRKDALPLMEKLRPHMGQRRAAKIAEILTEFAELKELA